MSGCGRSCAAAYCSLLERKEPERKNTAAVCLIKSKLYSTRITRRGGSKGGDEEGDKEGEDRWLDDWQVDMRT